MSTESELVYRVVVNHEEQYSIWPVERPLPRGWRLASPGLEADREACLEFIAQRWVDIRPASLRRQFEAKSP